MGARTSAGRVSGVRPPAAARARSSATNRISSGLPPVCPQVPRASSTSRWPPESPGARSTTTSRTGQTRPGRWVWRVAAQEIRRESANGPGTPSRQVTRDHDRRGRQLGEQVPHEQHRRAVGPVHVLQHRPAARSHRVSRTRSLIATNNRNRAAASGSPASAPAGHQTSTPGHSPVRAARATGAVRPDRRPRSHCRPACRGCARLSGRVGEPALADPGAPLSSSSARGRRARRPAPVDLGEFSGPPDDRRHGSVSRTSTAIRGRTDVGPVGIAAKLLIAAETPQEERHVRPDRLFRRTAQRRPDCCERPRRPGTDRTGRVRRSAAAGRPRCHVRAAAARRREAVVIIADTRRMLDRGRRSSRTPSCCLGEDAALLPGPDRVERYAVVYAAEHGTPLRA